MLLHIYHHYVTDPETKRELIRLNDNMEKFMSDIDDFVGVTLAKINAQKTQIDGVAALLSDIKHKLADALAGESLSPAAKTKLAAIMPQLEANTTEITDAINANTDAAPPTEPAPTPEPVATDPSVPDPSTPTRASRSS
jgi:hypothetical protein